MHHSTREFLPAANFAELTHSLLDPRGGETVLTRIRGNTHFFFDMTAATWIKPLFKSDVARTGSTAIDWNRQSSNWPEIRDNVDVHSAIDAGNDMAYDFRRIPDYRHMGLPTDFDEFCL